LWERENFVFLKKYEACTWDYAWETRLLLFIYLFCYRQWRIQKFILPRASIKYNDNFCFFYILYFNYNMINTIIIIINYTTIYVSQKAYLSDFINIC
jgi:hypothetical protein